MATSLEDVAKFLQRAPHGALHMLRLFGSATSSSSYASVGRAMGMDKRTVAQSLQRLNREFAQAFGEELIAESANRYELTTIGAIVANLLVTSHRSLVSDLFEVVTNPGQQVVGVPVATNCLPYLSQLAEECRDGGLTLQPVVTHSADFTEAPTVNLRVDSRRAGAVSAYPYALYSQCVMEGPEDPIRVGANLPRTPLRGGRRIQILVLDSHPFKVIAPRAVFGTAEAVSFDDLWSRLRNGLIIPRGGAVKDLLDAVEPDWAEKRHCRSTDLEATLAMLNASNLVPEAAMIAHGSDEAVAALAKRIDLDMGIYKLDPVVASRYVAVTGFVMDPATAEGLSKSQRMEWMSIWSAALRLWGTV